jgi:hypothetical protein
MEELFIVGMIILMLGALVAGFGLIGEWINIRRRQIIINEEEKDG